MEAKALKRVLLKVCRGYTPTLGWINDELIEKYYKEVLGAFIFGS